MPNTTYNWRSLAASRYQNAPINGDGKWLVICRCTAPVGVFLFETWPEANKFKAECCSTRCKHNLHAVENLESYIPRPRYNPRLASFQKMIEAE
jgi:hypothetical protein